jgi:hypothetical protein
VPETTNPFDSSQARVDLYDEAACLDNYRFLPGVVCLPVAEDPPAVGLNSWSPVVVIRIHAPYRERMSKYKLQKQQNPPILPKPESVGKFVFTGGQIAIDKKLNTTAQRFDWACETEYVFVENCVSRPRDGLVLSYPPFSWLSDEENLVAGFPPGGSLTGAVSSAGSIAQNGYKIADAQSGDIQADGPWSYNTTAFFPGQLFNASILNGGPSIG